MSINGLCYDCTMNELFNPGAAFAATFGSLDYAERTLTTMPTKKRLSADDPINAQIDALEDKIEQSDDDTKIASYTDEIDRLEQVRTGKIEPSDCDLYGHDYTTGTAYFDGQPRLTTWCRRCGEIAP